MGAEHATDREIARGGIDLRSDADLPADNPARRPPRPFEQSAQPLVHPDPTPENKTEEPLRVPDRLEDLQGCWQTIRRDMRFVTDDEERKPVGPLVRKCFCFNDHGGGTFELLYADGVKCRAPLTTRIALGKLHFRHPTVHCHRNADYGLVPAYVVCENDCR